MLFELFSCVDLEVKMLRVFSNKSIYMIVRSTGKSLVNTYNGQQSHYISGRMTANKNNQNLNDAIKVSTTYEAIVFSKIYCLCAFKCVDPDFIGN